MRIIITLAVASLLPLLCSARQTSVTWQTLGNKVNENKRTQYVQRFRIKGDTNMSGLGFNMFARKMQALNPADTIVEVFPGYYIIKSERFGKSADSLDVDILVNNGLASKAYAPDGIHRINSDQTTEAVHYYRLPLTSADQWTVADKNVMPRGEDIFAANKKRSGASINVYDIIPSFKKITLTVGESSINKISFNYIQPENPEFYRLTIAGDSLLVECAESNAWPVMAKFQTKVLEPNGTKLPNAVIEDYPDYGWRGLHIDIARNFQTPQTMTNVLKLMVANGLNRLHFHIVDDEAWRLEIPALPELTEIGARRGYSNHGEDEYLYQIFAGDGNPDSKEGCANGYWTRDEFIAFIKTANTLGIQVIPEIESPGHARAAIYAMEARAKKGDDSYRLTHDGDTSRYTSAQSYHDNAMNPALPGVYKFMNTVFDALIDMYDEAGVPLMGIHIGGDEVPRGAWLGSDKAQQFMAENNLKNAKELHAYFVEKLANELNKRDVKMYGWEEIAVGHGEAFNDNVRPVVGGVNCWHATPSAALSALSSGYPVILGNVNRLYLDMMYSPHPEEQGLSWGGYVDEFDALGSVPEALLGDCAPEWKNSPLVLGLQGQLWAETIRNPEQLYTFLLPKMLGLAERAWNAESTYSEAEFNTIIGEKELPIYTTPGTPYKVHIRQPGIHFENGTITMNAPYTGGEIRYTTNGTEPTENSELYIGPFSTDTPEDVRAVYYRNGCHSVTTRL